MSATQSPGADQFVEIIATPKDARSAANDGTGPTVATGVAGIRVGNIDSRGLPITEVFFKRAKYAIYGCDSEVLVQYADDESEASTQIRETAVLLPLRENLRYLTQHECEQKCYRPQIADALRLGMEKQSEVARQVLDSAIKDCVRNQDRRARAQYLKWAVPIGSAAALVPALAAWWLPDPEAQNLLVATSAGATGALLSITLGIRKRTAPLDSDSNSNVQDAMGRLLIGVISAIALFLFLSSGMLETVTVGSAKLVGDAMTWKMAFVVGFASGFLERLVPDLLEKKPG